MRNVVLTRVDERLIHGQVMTSWLKLCNAVSYTHLTLPTTVTV